MNRIKLGDITIGGNSPVVLVAGPCVLQDEAHLFKLGGEIQKIAAGVGIPLVLKTSFDKANRTSLHSFRGPGLKKGLPILKRVRDRLGLPLLTDVHEPSQVQQVAQVADLLQIPAFLCRQTDLLREAAETQKPINIKKGQFLAPWDVRGLVEKIEASGNRNILLTERGVSFGYNNLVVDMRALVFMRQLGYPVMYDGTHSLQLPGSQGGSTGGDREYIPHLSRSAVACGIDALFLEVHEDPDRAPCDGPNMLPLSRLESLLIQVRAIDTLVKEKKWIP